MGISDFCQDLTGRAEWKVAALGVNGLERIPRAIQGMMFLLAAMTPRGMRCPLLCKRLTARQVVVWCSRCRGLACPFLCLRDYCESLGGKRFGSESFSNLSDGCALAGSIGEGTEWILELLSVELTLGTLQPLRRTVGWITLWGGIGEPLFGLLAQMSKECSDSDCTHFEWSCLGASKMCETLYQAKQESPLLGICSGILSMYQAYKEIEWKEPQ